MVFNNYYKKNYIEKVLHIRLQKDIGHLRINETNLALVNALKF